MALYEALERHFGFQDWWPADSPFEVIVGALLAPQASWGNVARAIEALKGARRLSPEGIHAFSVRDLEQLIRPSGFYRQKARRLKGFCTHLEERHRGALTALLSQPREALRSELLSLEGIGPETADSILLYAAGLPRFVIDAYTMRICERLGMPAAAAPPALQQFFERRLPEDVALWQEFHALFVALGKRYCRPSPECVPCPLRGRCPEGLRRLRGRRGAGPRRSRPRRRAAARSRPRPRRGASA